MPRTIYLAFDEEVISALQKIRKAGSDDIILVVPKGARIFRNLTNLKLLREQAQKFQKKLTLATADEKGRVLATRAGLVLNTDAAVLKEEIAKSSILVTNGPRRPLGDIVPRKPIATAPVVSVESKPLETKEELSSLIGPKSQSRAIELPQKIKQTDKPKKNFLKYLVIGTAVVFLVAGTLLFYVLPQAEILAAPRSEPVTRDLELLVDSQAAMPDAQNLSIPGKKITEEISDEGEYPTTGIKNIGEKASGFVTLYNFSKNTLILKKTTTRLEANGKVYYFLQDVGNIRPTARIGTDLEIDPTSLIDPVPIVAAEAGEASNLPAGTRFEIYNEVFGHKAELLYAINGNPIAGGTNRQVKIISEADVKAARADLAKKVAAEMMEQMKGKLSADSRLADNAYGVEIMEESLSKPVGEEAENFKLTQKIKINALVYDEKDVRDLIVERIVKLLPENKYLLSEGEQNLSSQFVSLDLSAGSGTLRAHFESRIKYRVNPEFLVKSILGKNETQVKEILLSRPEIEDLKVNFYPFWVKSVPRFESKVNFKVLP
ncbi:MAG: hypothetical protein AAB871_01580 [Patescibacteria group bacterium]